jgi:histidyl-tRNA synthetase
MDFTPPRGTADWLPPGSERLRAVYDLAHGVARRFGYRYVETPTFEDSALFARSSGDTSDVVSKEMYTFADRGGRSVTLRPEGTAPVVRAYLQNEHDLPVPFKCYYVETLFRYGRPQRGRLREYRSFGIEVIGADAPEGDVEVILVGAEFLRQAGVSRFELQLNSIGDETCRPRYRRALLDYLEENAGRLRDEHHDRFRDNPLRVLDCKDEACRAVAAGAPKMSDDDWSWLCEDCRAHFEAVRTGLEREGTGFVIVPTLVRGLDYYTRTVFEFVSEELSQSQGSIIAGGRYDGLAEVLGSRARVPAVGFGLGIERVLLALDEEGAALRPSGGLDAYVVFMGDAVRAYARDVASRLRALGRSVDMPLSVRPLKAQLHAADRSGARFAVILGEKEATGSTVTWKRLSDGAQFEGSIEDGARALDTSEGTG